MRRIAAEQGFANAKKAESEDICFIADGDYAGYIERRCGHPATPGDIVWRDGSVVGRHNGALRYTIGQRKGLGVAMAHPVYVTGVDAANNIVHLGEAEDLTATVLTANDWIWSAPADRMEQSSMPAAFTWAPSTATVKRTRRQPLHVAPTDKCC